MFDTLKMTRRIVMASLVALLASGSIASANASFSGILSAGTIVCLNAELVPSSFTIQGNATDLSGNPIAVKWSIWHGPSPLQINAWLLKQMSPSIWQVAGTTGDYMQACVNNNSGVDVYVNLSQYVR